MSQEAKSKNLVTTEVSMTPLLEYEGKSLLKKVGISVPPGVLILGIDDIKRAFDALHRRPLIIKAQVPTTGRFRRGLVRLANDIDEAVSFVQNVMGKTVEGYTVSKFLAEEFLEVEEELFVSITVDESYKFRGPVLLLSRRGGVSVEDVARARPGEIAVLHVDYLQGIDKSVLADRVAELGIDARVANKIVEVVERLYQEVFIGFDAYTVELNPLALTKGGDLVALDVKITLDDHALFRHPELKPELPPGLNRPLTPLEEKIWRWEEVDTRGTGYFVQLQGGGDYYVGFHGIGGGGAMLAVDVLTRHGIRVANYADTSGDPPASKVYRVIKTILSQEGIEAYVLIGPVIASQEQWHHAHAVVKAIRECLRDKPGFPVAILLAGNKEREAIDIIKFGLKDLNLRLRVYGREYLDKLDLVAEEVKSLIDEYRREHVRGKN